MIGIEQWIEPDEEALALPLVESDNKLRRVRKAAAEPVPARAVPSRDAAGVDVARPLKVSACNKLPRSRTVAVRVPCAERKDRGPIAGQSVSYRLPFASVPARHAGRGNVRIIVAEPIE